MHACKLGKGSTLRRRTGAKFRPVQPEPLDLDARDRQICPASPFVILRTGKKSERRRRSRDPAR